MSPLPTRAPVEKKRPAALIFVAGVAAAVAVFAGIHFLGAALVPPPRGSAAPTVNAAGANAASPAGPAAPMRASFTAGDWRIETSPGSVASLRFNGDAAVVAVDRFTVLPDGRYWVNLESDHHPQWAGIKTVTFSVRGDGLTGVRLYLENETERWRGPVVPVGSSWQTHALPLAVFEHQLRENNWKVVRDAPPTSIKTVSFKLGWYVNDASLHGSVELKDFHAE